MARNEDTVKLIIGKDLKIRFKSLCVQAERDMSEVARELFEAWCVEQEQKQAAQLKRRATPDE